MDSVIHWRNLILLSFYFLYTVSYVESGECCLAYHDLLGNTTPETWCEDFCCYDIGKYSCCDNKLLQAPASRTSSFCPAWFLAHVWVIVVIGVVGVGIIISVCACCICCLCRR